MLVSALLGLEANAQNKDTVLILPGSSLIKPHELKPHRIEFDEYLYRDSDTLIREGRFYIQLTYGMINYRPVYFMSYMGVSATDSGFDIIRFDRETLAIQFRVLQIDDQVAVLNFTPDRVYGNFPLRKDTFNLKIDRSVNKVGLGFDLNMDAYLYASLDLEVGMKFNWPAYSITTGKARIFHSEVVDKRIITNKYGRSYEVFDIVNKGQQWTRETEVLAEHHYISTQYPYYIGRDWWIESKDKKPYLWHRWLINDSELLHTTLEEEIPVWIQSKPAKK